MLALTVYYRMPYKKAALYSLFIILCSQGAAILTAAFSSDAREIFDAPFLVAASAAGRAWRCSRPHAGGQAAGADRAALVSRRARVYHGYVCVQRCNGVVSGFHREITVSHCETLPSGCQSIWSACAWRASKGENL